MITPVIYEPMRPGEFLVSEGNGDYSRQRITVTGGKFIAGSVLGQIAATGAYTGLNLAATDGSQTAVGILYAETDATMKDAPAVAVIRKAEVNAYVLAWPIGMTTSQKSAACASLASRKILVRW